MESRVVELRQRGQRQVRRYTRVAVIALALGAAVGVTAVGAYAVYRYTRPPSRRERLARFIPVEVRNGLLRLGKVRESWELGLRRQIPPMRLYLGTAAGSALATTLLRRLAEKARPAA